MKNKKLLVALYKLLKLKDENVLIEALDKEDGDESVVKSFNEENKVFTLSELSTFKENSIKHHLENTDFEVEQIPQKIYSKVKGTVLEKAEKELAQKHGITDYKGLSDLAQKIADKSGKGGEPDDQTKLQIEQLKKVVEEKESEIKAIQEKTLNSEISRDFNSAVESLSLDYDDTDEEGKESQLKIQRKLLSNAFGSEFKITKKEDKTIVIGADGKPVLNKLADPESVTNVVKTFAERYGFKFKQDDPGGRGTGSSDDGGTNVILKGKPFKEVLAAKNIQENTSESDKLYTEWKAAQN